MSALVIAWLIVGFIPFAYGVCRDRCYWVLREPLLTFLAFFIITLSGPTYYVWCRKPKQQQAEGEL